MKKLLIVDDSEFVLNLFKHALDDSPEIEALYAENYAQAMRIMRSNPNQIHAAILDYKLPDAPNGEVVALANSNNIPTIVLTGDLNKETRDIILKKNVINFILKNDPNSIHSALDSAKKALKNYDTTVLIADDSKLSRELIKMSLESIHLNIIEATNGQEALDLILNGKHNISLLIIDYLMPELDGLDLTFALRKQFSKAQLGIIAISSCEDEETISKFLKLGANDFVHKPPVPHEIINTVNANLELLSLFEQVSDMANKDFLTGAYNRRYFFDVGGAIFLKAKRKNAPLAVIMLDIDKFKKINDTYGHDIGDIALKKVKTVLDRNLRDSDLSARFGGEEFCILLEDISLENLQTLLERIRADFENNIVETKKANFSYTVSLGAAYGMAESLDELVKLSDQGLFQAKEHGRNQVKINTYVM